MTADGHAPFAATSSASKIALLPTRELVYPVAGTSLVAVGGRFYLGHTSEVNALCVGRALCASATRSSPPELHVWSPATLGTLATLSHPEARGAVGALALSPADGELLLALEAQSAARLVLWRWRAGECIAHVRAHDDPGRVALFLSPADGTCRIASASDTSLKFWAVASGGAGEFTFLQPAEAEAAAGAAATTCAVDLGGGGNYGEQSALQNLCGDAGGCVTGAADGALAAYAVLGGKLLRRQPAHHGPVRALCACGGDGRARFVSGGADGRVRLWDGALGPLTSVNLGTAALQHLDRAGRLQMAGGGMRPPAVRSLCWAGGVRRRGRRRRQRQRHHVVDAARGDGGRGAAVRPGHRRVARAASGTRGRRRGRRRHQRRGGRGGRRRGRPDDGGGAPVGDRRRAGDRRRRPHAPAVGRARPRADGGARAARRARVARVRRRRRVARRRRRRWRRSI